MIRSLFLQRFSNFPCTSILFGASYITVSSVSKLISSVLVTGSNQSLMYLFPCRWSPRRIGYGHILSVSNVHFKLGPRGPDIDTLLFYLSVGGCCLLFRGILVLGLTREP
jgi:hypothetical protein